jgi:hypothetical protein
MRTGQGGARSDLAACPPHEQTSKKIIIHSDITNAREEDGAGSSDGFPGYYGGDGRDGGWLWWQQRILWLKPEGSDADRCSGVVLSKPAFVEKAHAACGKLREGGIEKLNAYVTDHGSEGLSKTELSDNAYKSVLLFTIEAELTALRDLGTPSEDGQGSKPLSIMCKVYSTR